MKMAKTSPTTGNALPAQAQGMRHDAAGSNPLRGFSVVSIDDALLDSAIGDWHANIFRYWPPTQPEPWKQFQRDLPERLDRAHALGVTLILALSQIPNEHIKEYPQDNRERLVAFWADEANLQDIVERWRCMAEICKDHPADVWFDLVNEPLNWVEFPKHPKKWEAWAQTLVDEIRKIDAQHPIVIEPGPGGLCWGFRDFPLLKGENLIYSVHMYQPHDYTHQGIADIRNTDLAKAYLERQKPWPGTYGEDPAGFWDKKKLEDALAPAIEFQRRHGVEIFVGEFSAVRWAPNAADYLRDLVEIFERHGWGWCYHAYKEFHGWSLEHDDPFSDEPNAKLATTPTARAQVIHEFMKRNGPGQRLPKTK
jgi:aryl-phospho-beta-D-glucosidase BglC (GH1 family)